MVPGLVAHIPSGAIAEILHDIASTLAPDRGLNERYVHHAFSHRVQAAFPCLDLSAPHHMLLLHPEWPTFKKATRLRYAKYHKVNGCYLPKDVDGDERGAGFIDFAIGAIGPYSKPEIGVEFCLSYGWRDEDVVYDFVKVLDARNPFRVVLSQTFVLRDNNLALQAGRKDLEEHMRRALGQAVDRLAAHGCAQDREVHLLISEIATHERRHWHYDQASSAFIDGLT
jgi:hypothetical protein